MKVSLEYSNVTTQIDLPEIETKAQKQALNELVKLIHESQNQLIEQICGPKYFRNHTFKRSGSYGKTVITNIAPKP